MTNSNARLQGRLTLACAAICCLVTLAALVSAPADSGNAGNSRLERIEVETADLPDWQQEEWKKIEVFASFFDGVAVAQQPMFQGPPDLPKDVASEAAKEIYVGMLLRPKKGLKSRLMSAKGWVIYGERKAHWISINPRSLIRPGESSFGLHKIIDADLVLRPISRDVVLETTPKLRVKECEFYP